jgi:hypothetical protein
MRVIHDCPSTGSGACDLRTGDVGARSVLVPARHVAFVAVAAAHATPSVGAAVIVRIAVAVVAQSVVVTHGASEPSPVCRPVSSLVVGW